MTDTIAIILLAAGESSRMGRPKQLLAWQGIPLLLQAAQTATRVTSRTTVVLGANSEAHRDLIKDMPVTFVFNEHWHNGMGSSLKAGLKHIMDTHPDTEAVIIMTCDQPLITPQHLTDLIDIHRSSGKSIVASQYQDTVGIPVLFSRKLFPQILTIGDEQGAKKIITANTAELATVCFPEAAIDLDTEQDYNNFINRHTP